MSKTQKKHSWSCYWKTCVVKKNCKPLLPKMLNECLLSELPFYKHCTLLKSPTSAAILSSAVWSETLLLKFWTSVLNKKSRSLRWLRSVCVTRHVLLKMLLCCRMSTIKKFSTDMMDTLRRMIALDPQYFLLMPRMKQAMLVDRMVQSLVSLLFRDDVNSVDSSSLYKG